MIFRVQRFLAVFLARNKEFYRDTGALGWSLVFPVLIVISFGYIFNLDETDLYKVAVVGEEVALNLKSLRQIPASDLQEGIDKLKNHAVDIVVEYEASGLRYWVHENSPGSGIAERLLQSEAYQNPALNLERNVIPGKGESYVEWLFPGLLAMNVMWMALWGVGWVIVRQRKLGVLNRSFHRNF